jgi:hypothetical protein
MVPQLSIIE